MFWETILEFPNPKTKQYAEGTTMRVLFKGPSVERVVEHCHRLYPTGRIERIYPSTIDEVRGNS